MRENHTSGSVREALGNRCSYREGEMTRFGMGPQALGTNFLLCRSLLW